MNMRAEMRRAFASDAGEIQATPVEAKFLRQKTELLQRLHQLGILEEKNGIKIWDLDRLQDVFIFNKQGEQGAGAGLFFKSKDEGQSRFRVFELLKDEVGILRREYDAAPDKNNLEPRPIFYSPDNLENAFDPSAIAENNSSIGYWDIGFNRSKIKDWDRELELPSGERVLLNELYLSKKVFGDLKARRDRSGVLMVWDEESGNWRKFSATFFAEKFGVKGGRGSSRGLTFERPIEYLREKCPNLLERGLLRPEDFAAQRERSGKFFRVQHNIAANGIVSVNGARYSLGKEFDTRRQRSSPAKYFVVELGDGLAGVVKEDADGYKRVTHTFHLKTEAEKQAKSDIIIDRLRRGEIKTSSARGSEKSAVAQYLVFGVNEIDLSKYTPAEDNAPLPDEVLEDYVERVQSVADYNNVEEITRDLSMKAGIGIHTDLTWREQQWLGAASGEIVGAKHEIVKNSKKFGVNFLKTFLSCEYGLHQGEMILNLADRLTSEQARALFGKYVEISEAAQQAADFLSERFGRDKNFEQSTADALYESMLRRGKDLLMQSAGKMATIVKAETVDAVDEIMSGLEDIKAEILLLANAFRIVSADSGVELKDVKGLELTAKDSSELSAREREEMTRIFLANRRANAAAYPPEWLAKRAQEFTELVNSAGKKFYLLLDGENLLSFAHSEPGKAGRVYVGSFNTDPVARRNKIGSAFFKSVLDQVGSDQAVEIVVNRQNTMFEHYIKDFGFEVAREMEKGGLPYAELVRPPALASAEMLEAA